MLAHQVIKKDVEGGTIGWRGCVKDFLFQLFHNDVQPGLPALRCPSQGTEVGLGRGNIEVAGPYQLLTLRTQVIGDSGVGAGGVFTEMNER